MVICGVAAALPLLTYPPRTLRCGAQGAQRAPVAIFDGPTMSALCALHLAIPEQAPTSEYSDRLLRRPGRRGGDHQPGDDHAPADVPVHHLQHVDLGGDPVPDRVGVDDDRRPVLARVEAPG